MRIYTKNLQDIGGVCFENIININMHTMRTTSMKLVFDFDNKQKNMNLFNF